MATYVSFLLHTSLVDLPIRIAFHDCVQAFNTITSAAMYKCAIDRTCGAVALYVIQCNLHAEDSHLWASHKSGLYREVAAL